MNLSVLALGVLLAAFAFLGGVAVGMRRSSSRMADAILRRETRFRHPAGSKIPADVRDRFVVTHPPSLRSATLGEPLAGSMTARFFAAMDAASERVICGKAVHTSLGTVKCLRDPYHDGGCD